MRAGWGVTLRILEEEHFLEKLQIGLMGEMTLLVKGLHGKAVAEEQLCAARKWPHANNRSL